jgi:death on curing protein
MYTWLPIELVLGLHSELLAEHGGLPGPSKPGALEGALARPQQLLAYADPAPGLAQLAAAYGFVLARNHCFPDGNKRTALAAIGVFLRLNGHRLVVDESAAVTLLEGVAAGIRSEQDLAAWITEHCVALETPTRLTLAASHGTLTEGNK